MLEEWTYRYKPRIWHFFIPAGIVMLGWAVIHLSGTLEAKFCASIRGGCPGYETHTYALVGDVVIAGVLLLIALLMAAWMAFVGGVMSLLDYDYEQTGERWTDPHMDTKYDYDYRWVLWAKQVLAGRPIAREKWTGNGKLFTRPEYEKRLWRMRDKGVLVYNNGRDDNQGYRISGAEGRAYIEAMAAGRTNLPLPAPLPRPNVTQNSVNMAARETARDDILISSEEEEYENE